MDERPATPPRWSEAMLRRSLPRGPVSDSILGDLREQYTARRQSVGRRKADRWYRLASAQVVVNTLGRRLTGRPIASGSVSGRADGRAFLSTSARLAIRGVRDSWGFTAVVAGTLAIGIGANVSVFEVMDRLLLSPPDRIEDPDRVLRLYVQSDRPGSTPTWALSEPDVAAFQALGVFSGVAGFSGGGGVRYGDGFDSELLRAKAASAEFFPVLGVRPAVGRFFGPDDDRAGAPLTVVLAHGFWEARFAASPSAIGESILLDGRRYTIIGVAPRGFTGADVAPVDLFLPLDAHYETVFGNTDWLTSRLWGVVQAVARLAPGTTAETAAAAASTVYAQPRTDVGDPGGTVLPVGMTLADTPGAPAEVEVTRWLFLVSLLLMVVACANVANLLLMRSVRRKRTLAVHRALGMSTRGVAALILSESLLFALMGAAAAVVAAESIGGMLQQVLVPRVEFGEGLAAPRVFLYTGLATLGTALAAGLIPMLHGMRSDPLGALKDGGTRATRSRGQVAFGSLVLQTGLSVVLVVGAGLFAKSLSGALSIDLGFDTAALSIVQLETEGGLTGDERPALYRRAAEILREHPAVENASVQSAGPFRGFATLRYVGTVSGDTILDAGSRPPAYGVDEAFQATVGVPLLDGRWFSEDETRGNAPPVVVVNEVMAQLVWPGEEALGQCLRVNDPLAPCSTVVGIIADLKFRTLTDPPTAKYYLPIGQIQGTLSIGDLMIRTRVPPGPLIPEIRKALVDSDPRIRGSYVVPYPELLAPRTRSWRLGAAVFGALAVLALLVAGIGLYSVLGFRVAERTREFGIRRALGAPEERLLLSVFFESLSVVVVGVVLGSALAAFLAARMSSLLFRTEPLEPVVYLGAAGALLAVTLVASAHPARRASRADPMEALRSE